MSQHPSRALFSGLALTMTLSLIAIPVTAQTVQRTREVSSSTDQTARSTNELSQRDLLIANLWGLSTEEMTRAKTLMQGPRANFSVANLSPVEALGIHARSDAERRKYAELFAKAFHDDVERSLAWNVAYTDAMNRLYPNEPVLDFSNQPKVPGSQNAADLMGIPRGALLPAPKSMPRSAR